MTSQRDFYCNRCTCKRCTAERKRTRDAWPELRVGAVADQQQAVYKILGRLGLGPVHPEVAAFSYSYGMVKKLSEELDMLENLSALISLSISNKLKLRLVDRFTALDRELPYEVRIESVRAGIYSDLVAALPPVMHHLPFSLRSLLTDGIVVTSLQEAGFADLLANLAAEIKRLSKATEEATRVETRRLELLEEATVSQWMNDRSEIANAAYEDPVSAIEPWEVPAEVWREAFLALAIKHREPGFVVGSDTPPPLASANVIGDDAALYSEYMLQFVRAAAGEGFDPSVRLPDGHNSLAAAATKSVLQEARESGRWQPRRGDGAGLGTLKTVPADRRNDWIAGPLSTFSETFVGIQAVRNLLSELSEVTQKMTSDQR